MKQFIVSLLFVLPIAAFSFVPQQSIARRSTVLSPLAAVKFDPTAGEWVTSDPATEGPAAGYGPWGTLLRGGPKPFFTRLLTPGTYEQAVLKFMASDKADRLTAQANMDMFLENAQDWAYNRAQGYDVDYVTVKQDQVTLRIIWSGIVVIVLARVALSLQAGESFWEFLGPQ